jgi:EAL domain-containing protein (putative c-di-GMP-specific phosphodiesterase class I)
LFEHDAGSTDEQLMIAADIALHEAKERGGDRYEIFEGRGPERLAWVGQVRDAIDEDRLCLHAQPIFDLLSGERMGCEVLVRMFEGDGSVVPPGAFLPTAERFGLISEIDGWVVEHGIELAARGEVVTINVSARSIPDPTLIPRIRTALAATGADPGQVVFELTETAMATASEDLRAFGTEIERIGCALAIDDFGTGFGSLTYLKHLPVRYLKVDTEFVRGLVNSQSDQAIVRAIVTIAASLGMRTVAEGVEDQQTADRLVDLGVDYAQGFHLGRPHPIRTSPR